MDASANGGPAASAGNATESSGDGAASLDLTGHRDFLTRETAEDALAAMLAENAALRKARCLQAGPYDPRSCHLRRCTLVMLLITPTYPKRFKSSG